MVIAPVPVGPGKAEASSEFADGETLRPGVDARMPRRTKSCRLVQHGAAGGDSVVQMVKCDRVGIEGMFSRREPWHSQVVAEFIETEAMRQVAAPLLLDITQMLPNEIFLPTDRPGELRDVAQQRQDFKILRCRTRQRDRAAGASATVAASRRLAPAAESQTRFQQRYAAGISSDAVCSPAWKEKSTSISSGSRPVLFLAITRTSVAPGRDHIAPGIP